MKTLQARAAITEGKGTFCIETIEVAPPIGTEVRVQMKAAGICHTDYDSMRNWGYRFILGHEGAGIVESVGKSVRSVQPGDAVVLNWAMPCGQCFQCLEGNQHICERQSPVTSGEVVSAGHARLDSSLFEGRGIPRSFNLGTMSTYAVVQEVAVVKMEGHIPFPSACIIGCGVMTGYGSVVNAARVKPGSSVVVLGVGGVGLNVIQGARIAGAEKIIAVDISANRLEMSRQYGATHLVLARREDVGLLKAAEEVKLLTQGRGADYAFECTGVPELGAAPLAMIRNAGTAVQVSGIEQEITIDMNLFEWDKLYLNPLYGKCRPQIDFPILMRLYQKGDLLLDEMITRTYALEDLQLAFDDMLAGRNAKGVIVME